MDNNHEILNSSKSNKLVLFNNNHLNKEFVNI